MAKKTKKKRTKKIEKKKRAKKTKKVKKKTKKIKEEEMEYTKYEKARMLGSRALQISMGAPFLVKLGKKKLEQISYDPLKIAEIEYDKSVLPITVKRPLPGRKEKPAS